MLRSLALLLAAFAALTVACSGNSDPTATATTTSTAVATSSPEPTPEATPEATPTELAACTFERATPEVFGSVMQVITETGGGTAFAIGNGEFLTAAHVVADGGPVSIRNTEVQADATIVGVEIDTDIAILSAEVDGVAPVRFGDIDNLAAGQSVAVAGYPTYVEDDPSVVSGLLSKVVEDPDLGFGTFLQTDAAVNPGNSGGPMFNECGDVIGMVVIKIVDTSIEGISWAVAENTLQSSLSRVRRKGPPPAIAGDASGGAVADPSYVEVEPVARYIANTGGSGVSLRDDCLDAARTGGSWPEGAEVVLAYEGIGFCAGWSIVLDLEDVSWVRNDYLAAAPSVVSPPPPQPTAVAPPPATATPLPPTATPAPTGPSQEVIDYLLATRTEVLGFATRLTDIVASHNDELITAATASAQSYALQDAAYAYSDQILQDSNDLTSVSLSCEQARQWLGDSVFYTGLSAGYSGLGYEFWPNVSFTDADNASTQAFDSLDRAAGHINDCIDGR